MKIYSLLRKGESHPVYCEDFLWTHETDDKIVCAVLDGCSSGKESHFASAFLGKLLRRHAGKPTLREIVFSASQDLRQARRDYGFETDELLATVLLAMYDKAAQKCEIVVIGDGFVGIDDQLHEIDHQNQPDYWAYHLDDDFETWWEKQSFFKADKPARIIISTDGIDTFRTYKTDLPEGFNPKDFLLFNDQWANLPTMLTRKCNVLHTQHGFLPADDLGVVLLRAV